jgi:hypothetical protein
MSERQKDLSTAAPRKRGSSTQLLPKKGGERAKNFREYGSGRPFRYGDYGAGRLMQIAKHDPHASSMIHAVRRHAREGPHAPVTIYTEQFGRHDPALPEAAGYGLDTELGPQHAWSVRGEFRPNPSESANWPAPVTQREGAEAAGGVRPSLRLHVRMAEDAPQTLAHELAHYSIEEKLPPLEQYDELRSVPDWQSEWAGDKMARRFDLYRSHPPPKGDEFRHPLRDIMQQFLGKDIRRGAAAQPDVSEWPSWLPEDVDVLKALQKNRD